MIRMKRYWILAVVCWTAAAMGDRITDTRGLPYRGTIVSYQNKTLRLRAQTAGRDITRTVDQVRSLEIDDFDAFNQAEKLVTQKKYPQAVEAYEKASRSTPKDRPWLTTLLHDRMYQARVQGGMIDEAVKDWLAMMDADPKDKVTRALAPETFAPEGDPANAAAVKLLDAKLAQLGKDPKTRDYAERLLKLKMKLLEAMGESQKASQAAEAITRLDAPAKKDEEKSEDGETAKKDDEEPAPAVTPARGDLEVLEQLVKAGKYDDVIEKLAPRLESLPRNELAGPLFLLAKAQWLKYQADEPKDPKLLLRAGLNLMWVYSAFGNSDDAPEALYLAAEVHTALKDAAAARRALEELVEQFGGAEDNPWVEQAQRQLDTGTTE
ncbi:MAG: hypothetical protein JXA11_05255 [Phycisphaerae bacterium]|nr:hypothetical protein [Phycisphaerae bacterium]